jgi:hypothetical protein
MKKLDPFADSLGRRSNAKVCELPHSHTILPLEPSEPGSTERTENASNMVKVLLPGLGSQNAIEPAASDCVS